MLFNSFQQDEMLYYRQIAEALRLMSLFVETDTLVKAFGFDRENNLTCSVVLPDL